jgi:hypothetical protein
MQVAIDPNRQSNANDQNRCDDVTQSRITFLGVRFSINSVAQKILQNDCRGLGV